MASSATASDGLPRAPKPKNSVGAGAVSSVTANTEPGPPRVVRAYAETSSRAIGDERVHPRTISEVFGSFARANFRVDTVLEPPVRHDEPSPFWSETMTLVPATLVVRGRKDGV